MVFSNTEKAPRAATIRPDQSSILTWSLTDAIYTMVSPEVGPVRDSAAVVHPIVTTTYRLYVTNQYGRTTKSVTVQ